MEKLTFSQLRELCYKHNEENHVRTQYSDKNPLICRVVYKQENYSKPFSEHDRTYQFRSDEKYFLPNMLGSSIWGDCLDGKDLGVRLDKYDWDVEYCYIV